MSESNRQTEWSSNFEQVKTFAANNKRWPSTTSKDLVEKTLGQWWSRQKYLLNKKTSGGEASSISAERETVLKNLIESYTTFERDGIWDTRYSMVVDKLKADKKLWAYSTTNDEEQKSIRWWNQQKTFARKFKLDPTKSCGGMTQVRYTKIEALMRVMGDNVEESTQPKAVTVAVNTVSSSNPV